MGPPVQVAVSAANLATLRVVVTWRTVPTRDIDGLFLAITYPDNVTEFVEMGSGFRLRKGDTVNVNYEGTV